MLRTCPCGTDTFVCYEKSTALLYGTLYPLNHKYPVIFPFTICTDGTAGGAAGGAPRWARGACLSLVYSAASTSVYGGSSVVLLSCTSTRTAEDDRRVGAAPGTWCGVLTAYHFTAYHFTACHLPLTTGLRTSTYHSKSYHAYLLLPVVGLVRLTVYECSHLPVRTYHVLCLLCICAQ